jgi:hypothetical protein
MVKTSETHKYYKTISCKYSFQLASLLLNGAVHRDHGEYGCLIGSSFPSVLKCGMTSATGLPSEGATSTSKSIKPKRISVTAAFQRWNCESNGKISGLHNCHFELVSSTLTV